jgi:hypothetical protein
VLFLSDQPNRQHSAVPTVPDALSGERAHRVDTASSTPVSVSTTTVCVLAYPSAVASVMMDS